MTRNKIILGVVSIWLALSSLARAQVSPVRANDFLNSLGACTHIIQGIDTPGQVIAALQYSGLRNIRDDATHDPAMHANLCAIHTTTGAMVDELPIVDSDPKNIQESLTQYEALAACGAILDVEGPNEPNNFNFTYLGNTCSTSGSFGACARYQAALYQAVKADPKLAGVPVWSMTEPAAEPDNQGLQFLTIPIGADTVMPGGTIFADVANLHNYVQGNGQTAIADNQAWYAESNAFAQGPWDGLDGEFIGLTWSKGFPSAPLSAGPNMPKVTTETGWPSTNITQDQQGKLLVNLFLSAVKENWSHTFIYLMFDEPSAGSGGYGLFAAEPSLNTTTATPKLSGTYIHNMTTILHDTTSAFTPVAFKYSIPGEPATVHDLLIQKSDGIYELAVWGDQVIGKSATVIVTTNLGTTIPTVNVYDVTSGTTPIQVLHNVNSIPLTMTDHAFFIEFAGSGQLTPTPTASAKPISSS
jgi:hypothetical protein